MRWSELRQSLRALARRPGFALTAILVVALGIGANAAIFRIVNAVMLRPLPFDDPDRLVRLYLVPQAGTPRISLRPESFLAIRERATGFEGLVGQRLTAMSLRAEAEGVGGGERVNVIAVSEGWASLMGVRPRLGRAFSAEEERQGEGSGVALLSDGFWRRRFGADPAIVGRTLVLDRVPRTVIGVLGPGFAFPYGADFWTPMRLDGPQTGPWGLNAPARLVPGVELGTVQAELRRISPELEQALPAIHRGMTVVAIPLRETLLEGGDRLLAGLLGAVGFLVLLVAANLAGLLLVRLEERGQEFAVRAALGAGGGRLLVPFVLEAATIVAVGGGLGFAAASVTGRWLAPLVPEAMADLLASTAVDGRVALFTLAVAALVVLCVAAPAALGAARRDPASALQGSARPGGRPGRWRAQRLLAAGEVALALGLAIGAGGLLRDVARRLDAGAGYAQPEAVQTFRVSLNGPAYDQGPTRSAAVDALVERIAALPEVAAAGATTTFPSAGGNQLSQFELEHVADADGERRLANHRLVTPGFFEALGLSVLRGRLFTAADRADTPPVVVVNASLARRAFGDADPIGRRLRDRRDPGGRWLEIVGVVPDVREFYDVDDTYYAPYVQHAGARAATQVTIALRGGSDRGAGVPTHAALRAAVATVDPDFAVADLATAAQLLDESVAGARAASRFAGFFAFFGLALAAVGLYGTVARAVAGRRREIGLRRALGAPGLAVVGLFFRQGIATAAAGIVAGSALGGVGGRWLLARAGSGAGVLDAGAVALAATVVVVAVVGATLWPAWRALRVDPGTALRAE